MHWPADQASQVSGEVVSALDFLPTFCDLAGATVPKFEIRRNQFLHARVGVKQRSHCYGSNGALNERRVAMRAGKWKVPG